MSKWQKWLKRICSCAFSAILCFGAFGCGTENNGNGGGEEETLTYTVTFELCTDLNTTPVFPIEVEKGETVSKPNPTVRGENPNNAEVEGWYLDREYTTKWNFYTDTVEENLTLYAKWINQYKISYYLGDNLETPMYEVLCKEGKKTEKLDWLSAGFRSDGFFTSPDYTEEFDFDQPITKQTNIYIHRSDEFYFDAQFIKRFKMEAASAGKDGSTKGEITYVEDGEDSYAKVNFGYSEKADPHMYLEGVTLDISRSPSIKIVMKNMGSASSLKFFFVGWYNNDGKNPEYVNGRQSVGEDRAYTYRYAEHGVPTNMTEEDPWVEITIDLADLIQTNGVSTWGETVTLIRLRIDSCYISENEKDLSNELWIKSIEGVGTTNYKGAHDSDNVKALIGNDTDEALKAKSETQTAIERGWVFPKERENVVSNSVTDENEPLLRTYNKESGLVLYAPYRSPKGSVTLYAGEDKIQMENYSTLYLRVKNYSYVGSLTVTWTNYYGSSSSKTLSIATRTPDALEYEFIMTKEDNWEGVLERFDLTFESNGVDNALVIECIEFRPYQAAQTAGFNFDDKDLEKEHSTQDLEFTYQKVDQAILCNVEDQVNGVFNKAYKTFTNVGYQQMKLNYKLRSGITTVYVDLTVDGTVTRYEFPVQASENDNWAEVSVPFTVWGNITNFKLSFQHAGQIIIKSIDFIAEESVSLDYSTQAVIDRMISDWGYTVSYESALSATALRYDDKYRAKYYFGYLLGEQNIGNGCVPLTGKTKAVIVYYNPGEVSSLGLALGFTEMTDDGSWKTTHMEADAGYRTVSLQTNMQKGEWAVAEIPLSKYQGGDDMTNKALAILYFCQDQYCRDSVYIRLVTFI